MLELDLMALISAIKEKPGWEHKVGNQEITAKWRAEVRTGGSDQVHGNN